MLTPKKSAIVLTVLAVVLCLSLFVHLYQPELGSAQPINVLDVSISGPEKIPYNAPTTYTASVEGSYFRELTYIWTISPDNDSKTKLEQNGKDCTLTFTQPTTDPYLLKVEVRDEAHGFGVGTKTVVDPPTYPNLYLGAYGAPYSYMVCVDQSGAYYYVINGSTGRVEWSSTDYFVTLNASLNAASQVKGTVLVADGEYTFTVYHSNFIQMPNNVNLVGESWNAKIKTTNTTVAFIKAGTNTTISNLQITAQGYATAGTIWVENVDNVLIKNNKLIGACFDTTAIGAGANIEVRTASNVTITQNDMTGGGHNAIYGTASSNLTITSNNMHENFDDTIDLNGCNDAYIQGNDISLNGLSYLSLENGNRNIRFIGNSVVGGRGAAIENSNSQITIMGNDLNIPAPNAVGYSWSNSSFITFSGNRYYPNAQIIIENGCRDVTVLGNTLLNTEYNTKTLYVINSTGFSITGNKFGSYSETAGRTEFCHPIITEGTCNDYSFTDNTIEAYSDARAKFVGTRYDVSGNTINRRGSFLYEDTFGDFDGTMTGITGTLFTYKPQNGTSAFSLYTSDVVGTTMGRNTTDVTHAAWGQNMVGTAFVAPITGNLTVGHFQGYHAGASVKLVVYRQVSETSATIAGQSPAFDLATTENTWNDITLSTKIPVTAGNTYWFYVFSNVTYIQYYYTDGGTGGKGNTGTFPNPTNPINPSGMTAQDDILNIYFDYEEVTGSFSTTGIITYGVRYPIGFTPTVNLQINGLTDTTAIFGTPLITAVTETSVTYRLNLSNSTDYVMNGNLNWVTSPYKK